MQYTGIFVLLRTEDYETGVRELRRLEGVEVHHEESGGGRVVVVVETERERGQEEVLGRIRGVPGVVVAEPVYFYEPEPCGGGTQGANPAVEEDGS